MASSPWWSTGVRFQCQGSGKCCTSRGSYGFVYLTLADRRALARHFGLPTAAFTRRYCAKTDGHYHIKDRPGEADCRFLQAKRCGVYEARPTQCRTWPFWPENMSPKAWNRDVVAFCPGIGKGPTVSAEKIQRQLDEQTASEREI